jgi:hypothetical protein
MQAVATIQAFRKDVELFIANAVYSFSGFDIAGFIRYREARTAYSDEIVGPRFGQSFAETVGGGTLFPVWPEPDSVTLPTTGIVRGLQSSMQPGEKAYQFRCWAIEQDEDLDSNIPALVVGMEIQVHRCLMFQDEEYFYCNDEMIDNQVKLLTKQTWRNLATLQDLVAGPIIDDVPTRESNVISYTVAVSASVVPD